MSEYGLGGMNLLEAFNFFVKIVMTIKLVKMNKTFLFFLFMALLYLLKRFLKFFSNMMLTLDKQRPFISSFARNDAME